MRGVRAFAGLGCIALAGLTPVEARAREVVTGVQAQAVQTASPAVRAVALGVLLLGALLIFWRWRRRESALGSGARQPPESDIDADWLERHVFSWRPELVGAAYDRRIAGSEVAAVLARMCGQSKLASRVAAGARGWNNLELWLLVDREELTGYERELIDSLFIAGKTTSGDLIQRAYRRVGFEPAAILRRHLNEACDAALGVRPAFRGSLWLGLGAAALGVLLTMRGDTSGIVPILLAAAAAALIARSAAPRESADGLSLRRNLLAARRFFAAELERPEPRLRDDWLPYLIALELSSEVNRWYQAFGRIETTARRQRAGQLAGSAEGAAADSRWTGGAGALGGIGASGAWIAATAGLTVTASRDRRGFGSRRGRGLELELA